MNRALLLVCTLLFGLLVSRAQTVSVTFQVDMRVQIAKEAFNRSQDQVSVRGSFNDWGETAMADGDADSIYTVTVSNVAQSSTIEYKYYHSGGGGTWEDGDNKSLTVGTSDTTLSVAFFNGEAFPSGDPANVTFEVDMRLPAKQDAGFLSRKVFVAGNFTMPDWGAGALEMADANSDSIYTVTTPINSAQLIQFKFLHTATDPASGTWESVDNRKSWIVDGDQTISKFWDDTNPDVTLADGNIFFEVDMSVLAELGIFNPDADSVQIRGVFNGWNDSQPARSLMNQDAANASVWFLEIPLVQQEVNGTQAYKFFIKNPSTAVQYSNTGWEVPIGNTITSDRNRAITFEGSETQEAPVAYFENIHPDWVIPSGTSVDVTYTVDMKPATPGFSPAVDTVYWIPRQPLYYALNGLAWNLEQRVLRLTDTNGDSVFTGTLTIEGPAFNGFLYNYAYTSTSGFVQEDGGQGGARVRFIGQPAARQFTSPWTMPADVWTNGEKPEEEAPLVTGVERISETPATYALHQNYPNPFNPSTTIKFDIATKEHVTLKIFNLLGQEVATLVNEELAPGGYSAKFDGQRLSTGVYIYRFSAGSFTQVKKMTFLK
ncbi:MAG: T9SS type A sorting domain-containing protein [Ignavibacteriales bacterium]|nr:T9SS type A sorting domain-containing protein [Ignavibacteriales bacterium]